MRTLLRLTFLIVTAMALSACDQRGGSMADAANGIKWQTDFAAALEQAKVERKPVLVDFYASWCGPCKQMDSNTFPKQDVVTELENWISVKVDVDQQEELARKYNVRAIPTMILFNPDGNVISTKMGYLSAPDLVAFAQAARGKIK